MNILPVQESGTNCLCCELIDAVTLAFDAIAYGFTLMGHPVGKTAYVKQSVQYFQLLTSALVVSNRYVNIYPFRFINVMISENSLFGSCSALTFTCQRLKYPVIVYGIY
jgi:hypothetical protein